MANDLSANQRELKLSELSYIYGKALIFSLICLALCPQAAPSQEANSPDLHQLLDKTIDVKLNDDRIIANATVTVIKEGKLPNSLKSLKVKTAGSKRPTNLPASKIQEIFENDLPLDVIYDKKNRCLVYSVEKRIDRLEHRRVVSQRLSSTRDKYWEPLSESDHKKFMVKHREFLDKVEKTMIGHQFRLVETEYFLFCTDLQPADVDGYIVYLDAMYKELCKAFGLSPEKNIWCGKCVVVAFQREQDYLQFETTVMKNNNARGSQGLCHQARDGTVIFSGFKGDNGFFGHVLVHETAHGFVHRYMTTARAPSWLNEGMSDWLANFIVGGDKIALRQKRSAQLIMRQGGWGDFLSAEQIDGDYYGSASTLVEILLALDKGKQFKQFFDGIKEGKPADESLKDSFAISYEDLKILYAQRIKSQLK